MQISTESELLVEQSKVVEAASSGIKCFVETPRKTGPDKPLRRIGAFDLFNLFTADIIRRKEIFTR